MLFRSNVDFRASALRDIGAAQAKGGLKPQALATLKQAIELAQKFKDAANRAHHLGAIASTQIEAGDRQQALVTLAQVVGLAQREQNAFSKGFLLIDIAMMLVTDPVSDNKTYEWGEPVRRMKTSFTPKEKQLARLFVKVMGGN